MRRFIAGAVLVTLGAVTLAGCSWVTGENKKLTCPASFIAPDTDRAVVFKGAATTLDDVAYGVRITGIVGKCERADKGLIVSTKIGFQVVTNDRTMRTGSFQYFVSVVDGLQNILTKRTYTVPFEFDARMHDLTRQDELIENLPLRDVSTGNTYAVVVGLQLTEAQLRFNRAARSPAVSVPPRTSAPVPPQQKNSASTP